MNRNTLGYAALALTTAPGCYESSNVLTRDSGVPIDARVETTDARTVIDAHVEVDAHDPTPCTGVRWIDPTPALFSVSTTVPLRLISTGTLFEFFFQNTDPVACDGPCPVVTEASSRGVLASLRPAYWAPFNPDGLAVGIIGGSPVFAAHRGTEVSWVMGTPATNPRWFEGTTRDFAAQVPTGHLLAEVAVDGITSRLYFATHRDRGMSDRYFDAFALQGIALDGGDLREAEVDPFNAMEHTRLRLHAGERDLIVAGIQRWDFPASVQIDGLANDFGINGSSCGTDDFAIASNTTDIAIAHGCGAGSARAEVRVLLETPLSAERDAAIASDRFVETDSPLAVQFNPESGGWVVAYWNQDGLLAVTAVNADLTVAIRAIVPGPSFAWAETFPGPIALSRNADGTFAIAWSATDGGDGTGALQRFTLGCD